jgi:hypothetical protein
MEIPMPAEISFVGDFSLTPGITTDQEIQMIQNRSWAPSTDDFVGVVNRTGGNAVTAADFSVVLNVIATSPKKSIQRINVFTHSNPGYIALGGSIDSRAQLSPIVTLNINTPQLFLIALDASTLSFLRNGGRFGPNSNPSQWSLADLKDRFMKPAQIVFYACHSGTDAALLQDIATTFGIIAKGFSSPIAYCPTFTPSPPSINRRMDIAVDDCQHPHASDFHSLAVQITKV